MTIRNLYGKINDNRLNVGLFILPEQIRVQNIRRKYMKKFIIMVIAVAVIATLAMTGVSAEGRYVWNHSGEYANDPFNDSTRVGHDSPLEATIRFKTDVSFSKILFPMVWCTAHANVTVEVLKGEEVVASAEFEAFNESANSGDVANVELDFGKKLAAGEYTLRLSVPEGFYAFFAYGEGQLSEDYIEYERGHAMFGLYTEDAGEGFVTFATEVGGGDPDPSGGDDQPAVTPPPTGDAAVIATAVLAVAAAGAAVVLIRKKVR